MSGGRNSGDVQPQRPYIKSDSDARNALGAINGFIDRTKAPADIRIRPASEA